MITREFKHLNKQSSDKYYKKILNFGKDLCDSYDATYEVRMISSPTIHISDDYINGKLYDSLEHINDYIYYVWVGLNLSDYQIEKLEDMYQELKLKEKEFKWGY